MDPAYVEQVLTAIERVPAGRVTTYGDLAEMVGGGGPRRVARVLSLHGQAVPWWRVVRADGSCAEPVRAEALHRLRAEGVPVHGDRVIMARARLTPADWAESAGFQT